MEELTKRLTRRLTSLLSVKSIVTLILTVVFAYMAITGTISAENVMTIFGVVIAFYFAKDKADVKEG